jgi:hypothetical protein
MKKGVITAEMTLLDIVSDFPTTEEVLKRYDEQAGVCICCAMLFENIAQIAAKYDLDLDNLLKELNRAARDSD